MMTTSTVKNPNSIRPRQKRKNRKNPSNHLPNPVFSWTSTSIKTTSKTSKPSSNWPNLRTLISPLTSPSYVPILPLNVFSCKPSFSKINTITQLLNRILFGIKLIKPTKKIMGQKFAKKEWLTCIFTRSGGEKANCTMRINFGLWR